MESSIVHQAREASKRLSSATEIRAKVKQVHALYKARGGKTAAIDTLFDDIISTCDTAIAAERRKLARLSTSNKPTDEAPTQ